MILDREGRVVANVSQPLIVFETEEQYNDWKGSLPNTEQEKNFIIIKKFLSGPGIMEVESYSKLSNYPRYSNTIYIDVQTNALYRYDSVNDRFIQLTIGGIT